MSETKIILCILAVFVAMIFMSVFLLKRRASRIDKMYEQGQQEPSQERFEMHWRTHQGCSGEPGVVD